jgi:hypothetical protein
MSNLPESTLGELLKLADAVMSAMPTMFHSTEKHEQFVSAEKKLAQALTPSTVSALILELQALTEDNTRLNGLIEVFHGMCEPHRKLSLEPMDKRGGLECCMCIVERAEAAEADRDRMRDALERLDRDQVRIELECWCDYISDRPCGYCLMQAALTAKEEGKTI